MVDARIILLGYREYSKRRKEGLFVTCTFNCVAAQWGRLLVKEFGTSSMVQQCSAPKNYMGPSINNGFWNWQFLALFLVVCFSMSFLHNKGKKLLMFLPKSECKVKLQQLLQTIKSRSMIETGELFCECWAILWMLKYFMKNELFCD